MSDPMHLSSFVVGGSVSHNAPSYVTRAIESRILNAILREESVTIIGSRQVGKTSLLLKIQQLSERHYPVAYVDLSTINDDTADEAVWASDFCELLNEQLLEYSVDSNPVIPSRITGFTQYWRWLQKHINADRFLILIDEASAIPEAIGDRFYSTIRALINANPRGGGRDAGAPQRSRVSFVFSGVFDPDRLIRNTRNSPFNIDSRYYLPDFSLSELTHLIHNLQTVRAVEDLEGLTACVYDYTSGHPYLSQSLARLAETYLHDHPEQAATTDLIHALAPQLDHQVLSNINSMLRIATEQPMIDTVRQIADGQQVPFTRHMLAISQLELSGAIVEDPNGSCRIRNRTYERVLRGVLRASRPAQQPAERAVIVLSQEDMDRKRALLRTYRENLYRALLQQAQYGLDLPSSAAWRIQAAKEDIARIKAELRALGVEVADDPGEEL